MALYALAGGFLNAYNRSEAAKKQAAAKYEEEKRLAAIEQSLYERGRKDDQADYNKKLADKKAATKLAADNQEILKRIAAEASVEKERLKLDAEKNQKQQNSILNRNKVLIEAVASGVASENAVRAAEAQGIFNILLPVYLQKPDFTFKDLPENFLDQIKKLGSNETPKKEENDVVSFEKGLGGAGNKQGNPGLNPVKTPGQIINTSKGSGG